VTFIGVNLSKVPKGFWVGGRTRERIFAQRLKVITGMGSQPKKTKRKKLRKDLRRVGRVGKRWHTEIKKLKYVIPRLGGTGLWQLNGLGVAGGGSGGNCILGR